MSDDQNLRSPFKIQIYAHSVCLMGTVIGYQFGLFNTFFDPFAHQILEINDPEAKISVASNLNAIVLFGVFLNSCVGGLIVERIGRHKTLLLTTLANILACLIFLIPNLYAIYFARLVFGFCGGFAFNLSQIIFKEILPEQLGKSMGNTYYIYHTLGIMIPYGFGSPALAAKWRLIFSFPLAFEVPKLISYLLVFKYESPIWLKENSSDLEKELSLLYNDLYNSEHAQNKAENFLKDLQIQLKSGEQRTVSTATLFTEKHLRPFLLGIFLCISNQTCGVNYLVFYSRSIYTNIGLQNPATLTLFMGSMNFLAGVFITIFSIRLSKRENLVLGTTLTGVSLFIMLLGLANKIPIFVLIGSYAALFCYGISLGGSLFPYLADAVPPIGLSFASAFLWLLNCLNAKFGLVIMEFFGVFDLFSIFTVFIIFSAIGFSLYSVETKNKSIEKIQEEFLRLKC